MNPYKYLILFALPATVAAGYLAGGYFTFLTPFCCFVLLPVLDLIPYKKNLNSLKALPANNNNYKLILFLFVPVVLLLVFGGSIIVSVKTLSLLSFLGFMISVGTVNGTVGFALAHEFIHKFTATSRTAGYLLLASSNYLHYSIEHVQGHHVYACTEKDPNSAKKGESFYKFLIRSTTGSFINAWKIESKRLNRNSLFFFSFHNRMLLFQAFQLLILIILGLFFGRMSVLFFIGQTFVAVFLHQQVNYLQHYGLIRNNKKGICEKMHAHHTWSIPAGCRIIDLFQVQNHADHHLHASSSYEKLIVRDESPKLPANYATMMVVSLIPPLWFTIIHKRLPSSFQ